MPLPNFLIIGAPKAGTTSLYHYLAQHPDVYMSRLKEPNYFCCDEFSNRDAWIRTRDAYERLFEDARSQRAIGEASPKYLNSADAPQRIAEYLPDVKLIVSLRNPADRAYSDYLDRLRAGLERRSVDEALQPGTYYFDTSLYYPPLSRYFERFERDRIKVVLFDDLARDPHAVVNDLCEFLEIDTPADTSAPIYNKAAVPRFARLNEIFCAAVAVVSGLLPVSMRHTGLANRVQRWMLRPPDPLPEGTRRQLLDQFRDDVSRTGQLVGHDLSHWLG